METYALEDWQLRTLQAAADAFDRCEQARRRLKRDGITLEDRFGQLRLHPLVAVEKDSRTAYLRAVRELALEVDDPGVNRPPRRGGRR